MKRTRHTVEQIIVKLREVEILIAQGKTIDEAVRHIEVREATYYKWRSKYGNLTASDAKPLKQLEKENERLKKLVADLSLDNAILKDVHSGKF